jgi:hypothetical protein
MEREWLLWIRLLKPRMVRTSLREDKNSKAYHSNINPWIWHAAPVGTLKFDALMNAPKLARRFVGDARKMRVLGKVRNSLKKQNVKSRAVAETVDKTAMERTIKTRASSCSIEGAAMMTLHQSRVRLRLRIYRMKARVGLCCCQGQV